MNGEMQLPKSRVQVVVMCLLFAFTLGLTGMVCWLAWQIIALNQTVRETRLTVPQEMQEKIQSAFLQEAQAMTSRMEQNAMKTHSDAVVEIKQEFDRTLQTQAPDMLAQLNALKKKQNDLSVRQSHLIEQMEKSNTQFLSYVTTNHANALKQIKDNDENLRKMQLTQISERQAAFQKQLAQFKERQNSLFGQAELDRKRLVEENDARAKKLMQDMTKLHLDTAKSIQTNVATGFQKMSDRIAKLAEQKIIGNEKAAAAAFQTALDLMKKKDFVQAKLYCLNAINHAPNTGKYFEQLIAIVNQSGHVNVAELEQIRSVLELGMYQVDSKDVPSIAKMLAEINTLLTGIAQANAKAESDREKAAAAEELELLKTGELVWVKMLEKNADECVTACRTRLGKLHALTSGSPLAAEDADFCRQEISRTEILLEYSATLSTLDRMLTRASQLLSGRPQATELPAINSMVQTANGILGRAWNIDVSVLPEAHRARLIAQAQRIADIEIKFNRLKSEPAIRKIQQLMAEMDDAPNGEYTSKINYLQTRIQAVGTLFAEVYDLNARRDIEMRMAKYPAQIREFSQARYKAYQQWAVRQCDNGFERYKGWTRVDADDAISVIRDYLMEIDTALLSPEISRLYQDVLQKQFAEMDWKQIAYWESKLATSAKKTLEDF